MTAGVLLGADLGTSGLKLVALDLDGAVVAEAEEDYAYDRPTPDRAESDVRVWRAALDAAWASMAPGLTDRPVLALGLSGQMHGAVLVDDVGRPLRPALLWPDRRAVGELDRWRGLTSEERAALANPLLPGMTGPMLAWLGEHEPEVVARASTVLLPKDALRAALVPGADVAVTDRSDASGTLLWDVVADSWSMAAVDAAGVPSELLPAVRPGTEVVGTTVLAGREVHVVVGAADTPLALLAAGTTEGLQVNLGTGAQVLRPGWTPAPVDDPRMHAYADADDGWYAMAAMQEGGSAWAQVRAELGLDWPGFFAAAAVPGPARAAVEEVVSAIGAAARLLGDPADGAPLVLTGGGARSRVVQQALADALGCPVRHLRLRSASAVGAAMLAARGVDLQVEVQWLPGPSVEPREDAQG
ncbi:FGGY family carbohydrate kinase [Blastococcus sp. CCUG 61487]|uniref:FGGY family carbohydrate kinase n=1 Tax=Blastococcus sp. CCUG 61487 TaxID=1840703 RepID=UPI0010BF9028|nr:FGGY family carbohydrate kinase [Blastococcus sp. CCUG 61487]TKJ30974.1 carbohydrate kinase [Blastococcus sp. CCUG 61487]